MNKERFFTLFHAYLESSITSEELGELGEAIRDPANELEFDEALSRAYSDFNLAEQDNEAKTRVYAVVKNYLENSRPVKSRISYGWIGRVAAMLLVGIGVFFFFHQNHIPVSPDLTDVKPGTNGATLTLSNGKKIVLSNLQNGQIIKEAGIKVTKAKNGELIYTTQNEKDLGNHVRYNTLSTSRKEQYQVVLPDGSHVWLNAASSIHYPTTFAGSERLVELTGEAYFEIFHDSKHPFRVQTATQSVEVLGTHFNINSYTDEPDVKTALLQGSVRIVDNTGRRKLLKPGQECIHSAYVLNVTDANVEEVIAWKNGYFMFDNEELGSVMRKLSRWYGVDVVYSDPTLSKTVFAGSITRFTEISQVLNFLHKAGNLQFKLEGHTITVNPIKP